jgi:hypothetical protein
MKADSIYLYIYLYVCWFFGLAGTIDVLLQPRHAFRAVERSKLTWFLIELLGAVLFGVFTWAYYAIRVRLSLVRAGGRPPRQVLRALLTPSGSPESEPARPSQPAAPGATSAPQPRRACGACGGRGKRPCPGCGGKGQLHERNPEAAWGLSTVACRACGGQGGAPCGACQGKGWVE